MTNVSGWGSIAGPLIVCAAACFRDRQHLITCKDSKLYKDRMKLARDVEANAPTVEAWQVIVIHPTLLESLGGGPALDYAFQAAVWRLRRRLAPRYPFALLDGSNAHSVPFCRAQPKADKNSRLVGYASCVGKMHQTAMMYKSSLLYPEYKLDSNCGYGTTEHIDAIHIHGAVPGWHRMNRCATAMKKRKAVLHTRKIEESMSLPKEIHSWAA